ncbi:hypothetical protein BX666DRAFT_1883980 [Dichotomocladium elegans]|nr:hypothetical protein BX666DRAFT_1883980 [Dichotomocladium elegans]
MRPTNTNRGHRPHDPSIGSRMPEKMLEELEEQNQDDRHFKNDKINRAANRKELRKQKRQEKGKRKAQHHAQLMEAARKRQKIHEEAKSKNVQQKPSKKPSQPVNSERKGKAAVATKSAELTRQKTPKQSDRTPKNDKEALDRLSRSNPHLFSLLEQDNLVSDTGKNKFEEDDRDIAYWEKKLGMNKKKKAGYDKAFAEDGLLDLLDGLDGDHAGSDEQSGPEEDDSAYLKKKRQLAKTKEMAAEAEAEKVGSRHNDRKWLLIGIV